MLERDGIGGGWDRRKASGRWKFSRRVGLFGYAIAEAVFVCRVEGTSCD